MECYEASLLVNELQAHIIHSKVFQFPGSRNC